MIIGSLEKKAAANGIPLKEIEAETKVIKRNGLLKNEQPVNVNNWKLLKLWIIWPTLINIIALKKAWINKCNIAVIGMFIPNEIIITPSWLKVDNATTFFISFSNKAEILAPIIVNTPIIKSSLLQEKHSLIHEWRISKYTPAVTNVEEWTNAETGVGAAIAAGNHALNGTWALLVQAEKINNKLIYLISK